MKQSKSKQAQLFSSDLMRVPMTDPLLAREKFAVSLRQSKRKTLIKAKRMKLLEKTKAGSASISATSTPA